MVDIASHTRAAVTNVTAAWAGSTWTWSCDLWPVWAQVSPTVHLKHPAHPSGQETETWMFEVIYTQSNWAVQYLTFSHLMPHCGFLSHTTPGSTERWGGCTRDCGTRFHWLFKKSHSIAWIHGLHCMVLLLQTSLDCNTGHTECSNAVFQDWEHLNSTNTTATVKHAEVPNGNYNTDTSRINDTNQGKYPTIYLNSQVLNLAYIL